MSNSIPSMTYVFRQAINKINSLIKESTQMADKWLSGFLGHQEFWEDHGCDWRYTGKEASKVKVKSLFWVHIQAQSSALQTLTITFPGHQVPVGQH